MVGVRCVLGLCVFATGIGWLSHAHAEPAAVVIFVSGGAVVSNASGVTGALAKQTAVETGDTIDTRDGLVQLRFTDGAIMSLQPQTQFRIDDYRYEGLKSGEQRGLFTLIKGGLRTITGAIGKAKQSVYQIITDLATIGVRGTEYALAVGPSGLSGSVGDGAIEVCGSAGCLGTASGESFAIADAKSVPRTTAKKTDLGASQAQSPAVSASAGDFRGRDGALLAVVLPTAAPVVVADPRGPAAFVYWEDKSPAQNALSNTSFRMDETNALRRLDVCGANCGAQWNGRVADTSTDSFVAWGRWIDGQSAGTVIDVSRGQSMHYVVGLQSGSNLDTLRSSNVIGEYSLLGHTAPTSADGRSNARLVDATLTAHFSATPSVDFSVHVDANGLSFRGFGSGPVNDGVFSGFGAAQAPGRSSPSANASVQFSGFFSGPNAERAGVVYELGAAQNTFIGAAAFSQGALAPGR